MLKTRQTLDQDKRTSSQTRLKKGQKALALIGSVSGLALVMALWGAKKANAVEEIKYTVVEKQDAFEIRQYSAYLQAETEVNSSFNDAGTRAFQMLFRYIDGNNQTQIPQQGKNEKIAMTAPVMQQGKNEKIAMTAPVMQQGKSTQNETYLVSFVLPQTYTLETAPIPQNPNIKIRQVPEKLMAVLTYSGFWSEDNYQKHEKKLFEQIKWRAYQAIGSPLYARYNAPFTPWFLRRNEIMVEVIKN